MEGKHAYQCFAPHLKHLRFCGYFHLDQNSPKIKFFLHKVYMRIAVMWIFLYIILQTIKIYEVRSDTDTVIAMLFVFLTVTHSLYKQIVFTIKSDEIEELFEILKGPYYNQDRKEHEKYLLKTSRHSYILLLVDNGVALFTCLSWVIYPLLSHLQGKQVEFRVWLPFDHNLNPNFYIALLYEWLTSSSQAFGNTTMDVTLSFFLAQCQTQLRILRYELTNLVERSKLEASVSNSSYNEELNKRLKFILHHHMQIIYFADKVEDIFRGALLYQFIVAGWILCTSVYRMVDMDPASMHFFAMVGFVYCILTQVFLYCYYGNELTYESLLLTESIYSMDWLEISLSQRKDIIILLERVKRPIIPTAGVIPLSSDTFVKIIKSSYSFFTMLKATNE